MIAEVVFNLPLARAFHYLVPSALGETVQPGVRVAAPFGPRERIGFVIRLLEQSPIAALKLLRRVIDPLPVIAEERWALARWLSAYYGCSLGEALTVMVPTTLRLTRNDTAPSPDRAMAAPGPGPTLSPAQDRAREAIMDALDRTSPGLLLLHGVTASGKTELYLQAIARALERGRGAICLVPEIALAPQTIDRFRERFGERVAVWHSRLTGRQRAQAWSRMVRGEWPVVIGTRSAVFAPVPRLGLIILDEEHEPTYKQEDAPRYHARDVAETRARLTGAVVLLGSATPSVETYYRAGRAAGALLTLPERIRGRPLPSVEVVDMREELASRHHASPLSRRLQQALTRAIDRGEQAMLLLNRRGFARIVQCHACGTVMRCERCSVPLVYHASAKALVCHSCNARRPPEEHCPHCRKGYLRFRGAGTERIESELHRLFPTAAIGRMDADTTRRRESHRMFYDALATGQLGLLVGTQMLAKGWDLPQVTLVGVVSADTALNLPDFRAGERTFDLLTQVAGRAGRGDQPGRVLIQTYCPSHYAIRAAARQDYRRFYEEELAMRRRLRLPPFTHLIELTVMGSSRQRVADAAEALAARLSRAARRGRFVLLGPAPHRIPRLRRTDRMCLVLKGRDVEPMMGVVRKVLEPGRRFHGLPVLVNVDPL